MNQRQRTRKLHRRRSHSKPSKLSREDRIASVERYIYHTLPQMTKEALMDLADYSDPPIQARRSWKKDKIVDTIADELRRRTSA